jgi:hypothetical protein
MTDDEFRALVEAGPCVVMVAKSDMLRLLDEVAALRLAVEEIAAATKKIETFHINPEGEPNICVEGSDRFAHERDVDALIALIRARAGGAGDE